MGCNVATILPRCLFSADYVSAEEKFSVLVQWLTAVGRMFAEPNDFGFLKIF